MKKLISLIFLLSGVLFVTAEIQAAMVTGGIWHDDKELAVAIDLNHPEWQLFNRIELDFNDDREWGQIIDGSEWVSVDGERVRRFEFGVYQNIEYSGGRKVRYFGWSHNPLFENESVSSWFVFVDKLYFGMKSPESLQCYAHEWNPVEGRKIVYCQTIDPDGNVIPVDNSKVGNVYVRHEGSDWTPLTALAPPVPPVELEMRLLPNVLSSKSNGKYVTAVVRLPEDVDFDGDSLDVSLGFEVENSADSTVNERYLQPAKATDVVKRVINGSRVLVFKLPRKDIASLPAGEVTIKLMGQISSGRPVEAEGTILVR